MTRVALILLLALAACGRDEAPPTAPDAGPVPVAQVGGTSLDPDNPVSGTEPGLLPRYIGRWAKTAALCESEWTRLWADEVLEAEGRRCTILPLDGTHGDTRLRLRCLADGKTRVERWTLVYPEANVMRVESDAGASRTLVKC